MGNILIHPADNVLVDMASGHKYARCAIAKGEKVIKYGFPIGTATADIQKGEHVHSHNLQTDLSGTQEYTYTPVTAMQTVKPSEMTVAAYLRSDGSVGIRNEVWIINTVGCVNKTAQRISELTGALYFPHPYGCSQLGDDLAVTQKILCGLIRHPNAGGVLVLGLGCENNHIAALKKVLGQVDEVRIKFLNVQECEDEIAEGVALVRRLQQRAAQDRRTAVPLSKLKIGLKCGGSDGLSGITANPLVGKITDDLTARGGTCVLTEVPEMFGAEQLLLNRCVSDEIFCKTAEMINRYKAYFIKHRQPVSENPSPGNKAGGITTLEEKSLGCVQKGGMAPVTAVLDYGDTAVQPGLNLLNGPGNDLVAVTNLTAAGCHLILFTTGRGTPCGAPIPTVKIASNSALAARKPHWIDFDAQSGTSEELLSLIVETAGGKQTKNEQNGYREIAIFKDGVTL